MCRVRIRHSFCARTSVFRLSRLVRLQVVASHAHARTSGIRESHLFPRYANHAARRNHLKERQLTDEGENAFQRGTSAEMLFEDDIAPLVLAAFELLDATDRIVVDIVHLAAEQPLGIDVYCGHGARLPECGR